MTKVALSSPHGRAIPTAPPDGLFAAMLLAFLATAGLFYVNIMAAIVDGLVTGLGLTEQQAGYIGSANIYGAALGALVAVLFVKQLPWRPVAIAALVALIVIDLSSVAIEGFSLLLPVRFLHGIVGGILTGLAFAVIARTANPDRTFGMLLFVQFGLGGLAVMILPPLAPLYGTQALFFALALFSFVTLLMVPFLDRYPADRKLLASAAKEAKVEWSPLLMTLAAIFLFQAANMALLAYIIRLGLGYGLERSFVSLALGLSTWVALLGPLLVMIFGLKFGRGKMLLAAMVLTLVGTSIFHLSAAPWAYMMANCGTGITWGLVIAYLLGMTAEFDAAGRASAFGGFVSKLGLASGPMVAGWLLHSGLGYPAMINVALGVLVASALVMLSPAFLLDRKRRQTET